MKSVISNLFGAQAEKQAMLEIKDAEPNSEVLEMYSLPPIKDEELYKSIKVSGFVSSCLFGQGRSSTDRQFVFVNGRPVDYNKVLFERICQSNIISDVQSCQRCVWIIQSRSLLRFDLIY